MPLARGKQVGRFGNWEDPTEILPFDVFFLLCFSFKKAAHATVNTVYTIAISILQQDV